MKEGAPAQPAKKTKKSNKMSWMVTIGLSLMLTAVVLLVCFFLQGETKVTESQKTVETSQTLICEVSNQIYPIFSYDNAREKDLKINVKLADDKLNSISLIYTLYYDNTKGLTDSENLNRAAIGKSFGEDGLAHDALGASFSKGSDLLQFSLYATANEITNTTAKYFALDKLIGQNEYTKSTLQKTYTNKGLRCTTNN